MPQHSVSRAAARREGDSPDRRRFPRRPVPHVVVAVEVSGTQDPTPSALSDTPAGPAWAGSAIDISPEGLALSLPEELPIGSEVLLTFRLDDERVFARVPSVVVRKQTGYGLGAVRFRDWSSADRHALRGFLSAA